MPALSEPRYAALARQLRAEIAAGSLAPGAQFPTETHLAASHNVSRFTVREALRRLQDEGLIQRRRGSGTVVERAPGAFRRQLSNLDEILQYAADTRLDYTARGTLALGRRDAAAVGRPPGERWFRFDGARRDTASNQVIALTTVFLRPDLGAVIADAPATPGTIFQRIEHQCGLRVTRVTQDIRAVAATTAQAAMLGIAPRSPCLEIARAFLDASGDVLEISLNRHPADRFTYAMHIDIG